MDFGRLVLVEWHAGLDYPIWKYMPSIEMLSLAYFKDETQFKWGRIVTFSFRVLFFQVQYFEILKFLGFKTNCVVLKEGHHDMGTSFKGPQRDRGLATMWW